MNYADKIAADLLEIKAVKLNVATPFTWSSGWRSPIYCDNRVTLSHPAVRTRVRDAFVEQVKTLYPNADGIAGVATGAIALGVLVAEALGLPFVYVRSAPKGHGLGNMVEGDLSQAKNWVVIEDLISTGGSSAKAVKALQEGGATVLGTIAIFTYGFPHAQTAFAETGTPFSTLTTFANLLPLAVASGYLPESDVAAIGRWQADPASWGA